MRPDDLPGRSIEPDCDFRATDLGTAVREPIENYPPFTQAGGPRLLDRLAPERRRRAGIDEGESLGRESLGALLEEYSSCVEGANPDERRVVGARHGAKQVWQGPLPVLGAKHER